MSCPDADLAAATMRLRDGQVLVMVQGVDHLVEPAGHVAPAWSYPSNGYDSGVSSWTELELSLGADGQLWLERVDMEDIHLAGSHAKETRWFASPDGRVWASASGPVSPRRVLGRVATTEP